MHVYYKSLGPFLFQSLFCIQKVKQILPEISPFSGDLNTSHSLSKSWYIYKEATKWLKWVRNKRPIPSDSKPLPSTAVQLDHTLCFSPLYVRMIYFYFCLKSLCQEYQVEVQHIS